MGGDHIVRALGALGSGLSDGAGGYSSGLALAQSDETGLWVGGQLPRAGNRPSANLALWTATRTGG